MPRVEHALMGVFLLAACEHAATPPEPTGSGRQEAVRLDTAAVQELARQSNVSHARARELVEEDTLLATELVRRQPALAQSLERLVLARELSQALLADAARSGPPTEEEIAQVRSERWWELDRPRMVQVVHAVVVSEGENEAARALAQQIASAVAQAANASEFRAAATAVPALDQKVRVESLPPVTADGRSVDPDRPPPLGPIQQFAPEFAAAAAKLERVGEVSPVVLSSFGYHVLKALRIVEPRQFPPTELRQRALPEVTQRRALAEQRRLLAEQREQSKPQQERSALRSMAQVAVAP